MSTTDDDIRKLIGNLPKGLDETYIRCLRRIEQLENPRHREVALEAFRWTATARQPLTPRQAQEIVSIKPENIELQNSRILNSRVTDYCANLLTTDITNRRVQFTHASVKQFLSDESRLPSDLFKYRIQPERDNQAAAAMCFAYIAMLPSRKQISVRHEVSMPGNAAKTFLQNMAVGSRIGRLSKVFAKRSTAPCRTIALPVPARAPSYPKLDMHEYFINYWLPHCTTVDASDPQFPLFQKLCLAPDPELFPWLVGCTVDVGLYQQLIQYAVLERHLPLLRVVRDHLVKQKLHTIFRSGYPGTSAGFLHIAAALGHDDIIAELRDVCAINEPDADGKTPLAWAAENGRQEVVKYLVTEAQASVTACRVMFLGDAAEGVASADTMN